MYRPAFSIFAATLALVSGAAATGWKTNPQCQTSHVVLPLPEGQQNVTLPRNGATPSFITLGLGFQNYTCSPQGTYTSVGAVADLYDISCLTGLPSFYTIQDELYELPLRLQSTQGLTQSLVSDVLTYNKVGDHFFIHHPFPPPDSPNALAARFTMAENLNDPEAFIDCTRTGGIPAPARPDGEGVGMPGDVDWLQLGNVRGGLSTKVYRVFTKGGKPPASCHPGSPDISVKYATHYWFY